MVEINKERESHIELVIGVVGEKRSGKETFVKLLQEIAQDKKIKHSRFSDILFETLSFWNIPSTRQNLQKLAVIMDQGYGAGTLTRAVEQRIARERADIIILDGVRWQTDIEMVRRFPNNLLVYITAEPIVRYERTKTIKEKAGEDSTTFEQFIAEEQAPNETQIPIIGNGANFKIANNGSLEEFRKKVEEFYLRFVAVSGD